jgi:dTDP-4-amino-4,6-dideoxygalactose transaminase
MVIAGGGKPVFVDVERETCNIDPAAIPRAMSERTAFVLVTHLHGLACDMAAIEAAVGRSGVPVIEDAAQALGATSQGRRVGGIGVAGVLSFGRAKNVNAFFGGAAASSDSDLVTRMRAEMEAFPMTRWKDLTKRIAMCGVADVATIPTVFRKVTFPVLRAGIRRGRTGLSELVQTERNAQLRDRLPPNYARRFRPSQARTVVQQLGRVDELGEQRRETARIYHEGLRDVDGLMLPPWREDGSHAYMQFPIQREGREEVVRELAIRGLDVPVQHLRNTADLKILNGQKTRRAAFSFFRQDPRQSGLTGSKLN